MEAKRGNLNSIMFVICVLYIIRHIIHIITEGMKLMTSESLVYNGEKINIANHTVATYNIIISIAFIAIIVFILRKKK